MKTVGFSAGEVIFREGDAALAMYVIQRAASASGSTMTPKRSSSFPS